MRKTDMIDFLPYTALCFILIFAFIIYFFGNTTKDVCVGTDTYLLQEVNSSYYWTFIDVCTEEEIVVYTYTNDRLIDEEDAVFIKYCQFEYSSGNTAYVRIEHYRQSPDRYVFIIPEGYNNE